MFAQTVMVNLSHREKKMGKCSQPCPQKCCPPRKRELRDMGRTVETTKMSRRTLRIPMPHDMRDTTVYVELRSAMKFDDWPPDYPGSDLFASAEIHSTFRLDRNQRMLPDSTTQWNQLGGTDQLTGAVIAGAPGDGVFYLEMPASSNDTMVRWTTNARFTYERYNNPAAERGGRS